MARIRTIKPEFPHSESMGRVSRDARLLFVELWTICDDEGRARGNSRMLASLLFPYDDDAPILIGDWLEELEREGCIVRYQVDGANYLQVANWLNHQKIDKPSKSKIPSFDESSRILANTREPSSLDQGSRIKDQGVDQEEKAPAKKPPPFDFLGALEKMGVSKKIAVDWLSVRKSKRAANTETALDGLVREAGIAGISVEEAVRVCCEKGWQGFNAKWDWNQAKAAAPRMNGRQSAISNYAAQAAAARGESHDFASRAPERDITGEAVRVA